jgi:O-antigen/teichoic acid export membrane protein
MTGTVNRLRHAVRHAALARVGTFAAAAATHVLAMRVLGAAAYGEYVLIESIVFAANVLAIFGTQLSCFAIGGHEQKAHPRTLLLAGLTLIMLLVAAELLLGLGVSAVLSTAQQQRLIALAPTAVAAVLGLCLYRYLSEIVRIGIGVATANYFSGRGSGFVSSLFFALLTVLMVLRVNGVPDAIDLLRCYAGAQWLGVLVALVLLLPVLRRPPHTMETLPFDVTLAQLWTRGRQLVLTQTMQMSMANMDLWLLGWLGPPSVLGSYGLAKRFANWLIVPAGLVGLSAMKQAVDEYLAHRAVSRRFEAEFRRAIIASWRVVVAIVIVAALVPAEWIARLAGDAAAHSRALFIGLGVGQILRLAFGNGGMILSAAGHEGANLRAYLCGNAMVFVIAVFAIPAWGGWGAALAFSAGAIAAAMLVSRACSRRMKLNCDLLGAWRWA